MWSFDDLFCYQPKQDVEQRVELSTVWGAMTRADSRFAPSQWETSLQSNAVYHWLGANPESPLMTLTLIILMKLTTKTCSASFLASSVSTSLPSARPAFSSDTINLLKWPEVSSMMSFSRSRSKSGRKTTKPWHGNTFRITGLLWRESIIQDSMTLM